MTFTQIIGHQQQIHLLRRALKNNRLGQAYLFHGPEGIGKKLVAMALIRALFCEENGCGSCSICHRVDHHNHPDLHLLEPNGDLIKIDQIRELQRELAFRPLEAPRKVCLIDQADLLNPAAGNAFLKTLEEPPGEALLILISTHPQRLLPTIRSRCQPLPFQRLQRNQIETALQERMGLNETDSHILSALSSGSFQRALEQDRELYLEQRPDVIAAINDLSPSAIAPILNLAEKLAADKERLPEILEILLVYFRDLLLFLNGRSETELVNIDLLPLIEAGSKRQNSHQLLDKLAAILRTMQLLRRNINRQLAMEVLLFDLAA